MFPCRWRVPRSAQRSADKLAQLSAEKLAQLSAEKLAQLSAKKLAQLSAEKLAQLSAQKLAQLSAEKLAQLSAEKLAQLSAEKLAQLSAEKLAQLSAQKWAQLSAQGSAMEPQSSMVRRSAQMTAPLSVMVLPSWMAGGSALVFQVPALASRLSHRCRLHDASSRARVYRPSVAERAVNICSTWTWRFTGNNTMLDTGDIFFAFERQN